MTLAVALSACGNNCDGRELSDNGQYWVQPDLYDLLGDESRRVLVGTEFVLSVMNVAVEGEIDEDQGGILCVGQDGSGVVAEPEPFEFLVSAAGEGAVELIEPSVACPANTDVLAELGPDRYAIIGVDPADVTARWIPEADAWVQIDWTDPGPAGAFPDEFGAPLDELLVTVGRPFGAAPVLTQPALGERVEVRYSSAQVIADPELATVAEDDEDHVPLVPEGLELEPTVEIAGYEFQLPPVRSVAVEEITQLELVAAYRREDDREREWGTPQHVVAIARDAEGRRVLGPEVEWTLTRGHLSLMPTGERLSVGDVCSARPKRPRSDSATIEARVGEVVASVELEWTALPDDRREYGNAACEEAGCNCSVSSGPRDSVLAVFGLLGIGGWLRRGYRRRHILI
ncbi:MYXO-CTERM sorting domain-containing protein [Enhygromyxa salina]|uniref:MYXO-CTERM sorting domain-containing protein n=1 Tax=Enhygromyxa salina TaxID=215803 RepID=UPI0011B21EDC|nr:MYXO-CTERM sorting domain-containing protein [Enhygromyxa salina]